jgi:hypothetical protein
VGDCNDPNAIRLDLVNYPERKPSHFNAAGIILFWPSNARMPLDLGDSLFYSIDECFPDETAARS